MISDLMLLIVLMIIAAAAWLFVFTRYSRFEVEIKRDIESVVNRYLKNRFDGCECNCAKRGKEGCSDSSLARIGLHETVFDKTSASKAENARNNFKSKLVLFRRTFNAAVKLRVARLKGVK